MVFSQQTDSTSQPGTCQGGRHLQVHELAPSQRICCPPALLLLLHVLLLLRLVVHVVRCKLLTGAVYGQALGEWKARRLASEAAH